jgi:hypothetical protein
LSIAVVNTKPTRIARKSPLCRGKSDAGVADAPARPRFAAAGAHHPQGNGQCRKATDGNGSAQTEYRRIATVDNRVRSGWNRGTAHDAICAIDRRGIAIDRELPTGIARVRQNHHARPVEDSFQDNSPRAVSDNFDRLRGPAADSVKRSRRGVSRSSVSISAELQRSTSVRPGSLRIGSPPNRRLRVASRASGPARGRTTCARWTIHARGKAERFLEAATHAAVPSLTAGLDFVRPGSGRRPDKRGRHQRETTRSRGPRSANPHH